MPDSKNKKKNDKTKRPPPLMQTFVREGESAPEEKKKDKEVGGNAKKGKTTLPTKPVILTPHMFYVMLVMGMFMPNLLVLFMNTLNGLFGFQRPLLLTSKDPLQNGYLKPSIDLL